MITSTDFKENYKYRVINWYEHNTYQDSDWYAEVVQNDGSIKTILYKTSRCGMDGYAEVDIIPFLAVKRFKYLLKNNIEYLNQMNIEQSRAICKNREAKVVKGRKVPKGTIGSVFYMKENEYGSITVGILDSNGNKHWTYDYNLEIVDNEKYLTKETKIYKNALRLSYKQMKSGQKYIQCLLSF